MKQFYEENTDFKRYVDRVAKQYGYTVDEVLQLALTKEVFKEYKSNGTSGGCAGATYTPIGECV